MIIGTCVWKVTENVIKDLNIYLLNKILTGLKSLNALRSVVMQ